MGLFRDRLTEKSQAASNRRKAERMHASDKVCRGHSLPNVDRSPRPCPNGCGSTVRGGVCPSPDC